jgi:hypothetical protein
MVVPFQLKDSFPFDYKPVPFVEAKFDAVQDVEEDEREGYV